MSVQLMQTKPVRFASPRVFTGAAGYVGYFCEMEEWIDPVSSVGMKSHIPDDVMADILQAIHIFSHDGKAVYCLETNSFFQGVLELIASVPPRDIGRNILRWAYIAAGVDLTKAMEEYTSWQIARSSVATKTQKSLEDISEIVKGAVAGLDIGGMVENIMSDVVDFVDNKSDFDYLTPLRQQLQGNPIEVLAQVIEVVEEPVATMSDVMRDSLSDLFDAKLKQYGGTQFAYTPVWEDANGGFSGLFDDVFVNNSLRSGEAAIATTPDGLKIIIVSTRAGLALVYRTNPTTKEVAYAVDPNLRQAVDSFIEASNATTHEVVRFLLGDEDQDNNLGNKIMEAACAE